jgi:hypothetical protein
MSAMVTEVESRMLALEELTPEQKERLRAAAVRILIDYLLEQAALNRQHETQTEADSELVAEPQTVQSRLEM